MTTTFSLHQTLKVGDAVRYHSYAWGWRFGTVIGTHVHIDTGANPPELPMATVRFTPKHPFPTDAALPQFLLEKCEK